MNPSRPVLPFILLCAGVWFVLAVIVCGCLIAVAGKGQSILAKLLYAIGGLCLLALPAWLALDFALIGWYGGTPDPRISGNGQFFVSEKQRHHPISEPEYRRFRRIHDHEELIVPPFLFGAACIGLGRLLRPRTSSAAATPGE
jgi:hypothetical protein